MSWVKISVNDLSNFILFLLVVFRIVVCSRASEQPMMISTLLILSHYNPSWVWKHRLYIPMDIISLVCSIYLHHCVCLTLLTCVHDSPLTKDMMWDVEPLYLSLKLVCCLFLQLEAWEYMWIRISFIDIW